MEVSALENLLHNPSLEDEQRRTQNPEFKEERKQKTKSVVVQPTSTYYLPCCCLLLSC